MAMSTMHKTHISDQTMLIFVSSFTKKIRQEKLHLLLKPVLLFIAGWIFFIFIFCHSCLSFYDDAKKLLPNR